MKTIFVYCSLLSACFLHSPVFGQLVPGYMGKKAFVEAGVTMGFSSILNSTRTEGLYKIPFILVPRLNVDFNYVIGRRVVAKAGWSHLAFDIGTTHLVTPKEPAFSEEEVYEAIQTVYVNDFHVGMDFYFGKDKGNLAPIGGYVGLGLRIAHTYRILTDGTLGVTRYSVTTSQQPYAPIGFGITYGFRKVIGNRFLLSVCASSTLFPQILFSFDDFDYRAMDDASEYSNYLTYVQASIAGRYILGLDIGIGVFLSK